MLGTGLSYYFLYDAFSTKLPLGRVWRLMLAQYYDKFILTMISLHFYVYGYSDARAGLGIGMTVTFLSVV